MQREKITAHIVNWLIDYAETSHTKGFVVGISGGIDSAVTSALCAQTGRPLWGVILPIHQSQDQLNRGEKHLTRLCRRYPNVRHQTIDLTPSFEAMKAELPEAQNPEQMQLSLANTRARLRMTTLYYVAGIYSALVAGTGNKIEDFGIGFYTKYGDGGADLNPIADLYKSEVYELATHLGIDQEILNAPPTDGLYTDNRSDEDQIGARYPELEWAMQETEKGKQSTDFSGRKAKVMALYQQRHQANRHKWTPIPVCKIPSSLKE